jgi:hypothetical protein
MSIRIFKVSEHFILKLQLRQHGVKATGISHAIVLLPNIKQLNLTQGRYDATKA